MRDRSSTASQTAAPAGPAAIGQPKHRWSRNVYGLGHTYKSGNGYLLRVVGRAHPLADARGRVYEHILVAEKAVGHYLKKGQVVHHVNGVKTDNSPQNLVICENQAYHNLLHERARAFKATGDPQAQKCQFCGKWGTPNDAWFYIYRLKNPGSRTKVKAHCRSCKAEYDRARYRSGISRNKKGVRNAH